MGLKVNKIKEEYIGCIFKNGKKIGRFENVMECLDFRLQVAKKRAEGYYYFLDKFPDIKIEIDSGGGVINHPIDGYNSPHTYTRDIYNVKLNDYKES